MLAKCLAERGKVRAVRYRENRPESAFVIDGTQFDWSMLSKIPTNQTSGARDSHKYCGVGCSEGRSLV